MVTTIAKSSKHLDIILLYSVAKDILDSFFSTSDRFLSHVLLLSKVREFVYFQWNRPQMYRESASNV